VPGGSGDQPEQKKQQETGDHHLKGKIELRSGKEYQKRAGTKDDEGKNKSRALAE